MCGRFTITHDLAEFAELISGLKFDPAKHNPRFNICPSQQVFVVLNDGSLAVTEAKWGLIPSWANDPKIGNQLANARAETVAEKPSFRTSFKKRRCVFLVSGFYEWKKVAGQTKKIPHYIHMRLGKPFLFAGLWDMWKSPDDKTLTTCTIITTTANEAVKEIHERMPVILQQKFIKVWLTPAEVPPENLLACLQPYPSNKIEAYEVSTLVNSPANDRRECIRPFSSF